MKAWNNRIELWQNDIYKTGTELWRVRKRSGTSVRSIESLWQESTNCLQHVRGSKKALVASYFTDRFAKGDTPGWAYNRTGPRKSPTCLASFATAETVFSHNHDDTLNGGGRPAGWHRWDYVKGKDSGLHCASEFDRWLRFFLFRLVRLIWKYDCLNVQAVGSALELKKQFGAGYLLHILKAGNFKGSVVLASVTSYIEGVQLSSNAGSEMTLSLPLGQEANFVSLFDLFDTQKAVWGMEIGNLHYLWNKLCTPEGNRRHALQQQSLLDAFLFLLQSLRSISLHIFLCLAHT